MSVLDDIMGKKKSKNFVITELGKNKVSQMEGTEGLTLKIMSHLEENGESTPREIAERYGYAQKQVEMKLEKLKKDGWVDVSQR